MPSSHDKHVDFARLVDGLSEPVLVVDPSETVSYANHAAGRILGSSPESLGGTSLDELVPDLQRERELRRWSFRGPGGTTLSREVQVTGAGSQTCLVLSHPRPSSLHGESPAAPIARYRLVFDHAPLGILHFDAHGIITDCNERFVEIIGSDKDVLVGLDMTTLPDAELVRCVKAARDGRTSHYEGDYRSVTAGKETPVRVDFAPIADDGATVLGGVGIVEDVSERKRAEKALARADRMASLGTLAAGVAHEINTPLAWVMTSLELAQPDIARTGSGQEATELLHNAMAGIERVRSIVRDLRMFAYADETSAADVDLATVIETAIKLAGNEARARATIVREMEAVPPVRGQEGRLVQVFVNLLMNAVQAIPEGDPEHQEIRVALWFEAPYCVAEVRDTGQGIEPATLERIFEPFCVDRPPEHGTGLGLALCHGIVTSLGGDIGASSEPSKGSVFRVRLPAARQYESEAEATSERHLTDHAEAPNDWSRSPDHGGAGTTPASSDRHLANPGNTGSPQGSRDSGPERSRLLVVDDERRLAQTFQMALSPEHDVEIVTRGTEAIEKLDRDPDFDLVLCDLMMPDIPGFDIFEAVVASHPELADRFVFMTGGAFTERAREFLRTVSNPRLEKPFLVEDIERLLHERAGTSPASGG
jgi:PAS domain S-box-containing protein